MNFNDELIESAKSFARGGFQVIPLKQNSCEPLYSNWKKLGGINPSLIEATWKKHPNCNIGLKIGYAMNVIVIVFDHKDGVNSIWQWEEKHGTFPLTFFTRTSYSTQYYFLVKRAVNSMKNVLKGVGVIGVGDYVIAPPSKMNGDVCRVCDDQEIAYANESVYKLIEKGGSLHG